MADTLYQLEDAIEKAEEQERSLRKYKMGLIDQLFQENGSLGNFVQPKDIKCFRFETLVSHKSTRIEPQKTDLKIYVGLEHLDTDDLKIRRYGTPHDVQGIKLHVEAEDIIFGKRRAYQRKVAIAECECICSAHAMVVKAKSENIDPNFLPYLMQSDMFMNRAIQISEGSLSPTIKWKVLAKQQFYCPGIQKQDKLAELFQQFDNAIEQTQQHQAKLRVFKKSLLSQWLG